MRFAVIAVFFVMNALGQVVITDSGSTNRVGMSVTIDGAGKAEIASRNGAKMEMAIEEELHSRLMKDVEAALPLDQLTVRHCAKSVSFGSRMFVSYKGVQSPDISCGGQTEAAVIALQKDAEEIMALAKAKMRPKITLSRND
jgi:hypothetical protein